MCLVVGLGLSVLASCGGGGDGEDGADRGSPPIEGAPTIDVAGDDLRFDPARLTIDDPAFNVAFTSRDIFHTFVIEDADGDEVVAAANRGETDRGGVSLAPSEYVFFCDVPGHREAGMEGTLVVR